MEYKTATICIPPAFVAEAKEYVGNKLKICTVVAFPNGYATTETKCYEAAEAVINGADEIDMVANIGWIKAGRDSEILDEIDAGKGSCSRRILKVIIETCLLTDEEIVKMCKLISKSGADYIKTSTGFSTEGANEHVVKLMVDNTRGKRIKAAGGISSLSDARKYLEMGVSRLGTSRVVKLIKEEGY